MDDYISREEAKRFFNLNFGGVSHAIIASRLLDEIPAADVSPVVHGRWIYHPDDLFPGDSTQECSCCHEEEYLTLYNENYCPNCGAKMDLPDEC